VKYLSVCSGIEAATVAWHPLGWQAAAFSEIEAFPRAVLQHRWPDVPLHGDFTTIKGDEYGSVDLLVGGTPCQSFSVAGLRGGLADDRGNLALEFLRLAQRTRAKWLVWENVPGVLSSAGGRDFGSILGGLVELGYGFAYRVLDAQFFGIPQRRRRVFVVGCFGGWQRAAAVLFERHSLQGHPSPRRQAGQGITGPIATGRGTPIVTVGTLLSNGDAHSGFKDEMGLVPINLQVATRHNSLGRGTGFGVGEDGDPAFTVGANHSHAIGSASSVRRLTPRECERLQGFHDDYTLIPYRGKEAADGPRYKALGNSMAVPVMRWIGERISLVEQAQALRRVA
jgi:DNA (cytosine-5)-methyltransferase 1